MLRCETQKLSAYVDGELSAVERKRIQRHIKDCRGCRLELKEMRRVSKILGPAKGKLGQAARRRLHQVIEKESKIGAAR